MLLDDDDTLFGVLDVMELFVGCWLPPDVGLPLQFEFGVNAVDNVCEAADTEQVTPLSSAALASGLLHTGSVFGELLLAHEESDSFCCVSDVCCSLAAFTPKLGNGSGS